MSQVVDIFPTEDVKSLYHPFIERVISNIEWVNEGDDIVEFTDVVSTVKVKSPCSGYFVPNNIDFPVFSDYSLGVVVATKEETFPTLYYTDPYIEQDPFTSTKKIVWKGKPKVTFTPFNFNDGCIFRLSEQLFFSFDYIDDKGVIVFKANDKLKISKNDHIAILFENGKILDFQVQEKPIKGGFSTIICTLYQDDIDLFLQSKMVSYRVIFNKEGESPITVKCGNFYGHFLFEATVSYVNYYLGVLNNLLPDYHLPKRTVAKTPMEYKFNWCFVYLMRDNTNGYHKIGISNKPEYREKTLQSEKPSIEMLACKKFPTRKIAEAIESALHTAYSQQRVRGEWFNLDDVDVAAIIETLK
jgi:hypothetical protein